MSFQKHGRPKGAKNHRRPVVVSIPPSCPQDQGGCGATDYEILRIANEMEYAGEINGHCYDRIIWRRVRCRACGNHFTVKSYEATPRNNSGNPAISSDSELSPDDESP